MSETTPRRKLLEVEDVGEVTIVDFTEKVILDEQSIQIIGEQLFCLVDELGRRKLVLNFQNVEYLCSSLLGKLITLQKKVTACNAKLVLCYIIPEIYVVFQTTQLHRLFTITKTEEAALGLFRS